MNYSEKLKSPKWQKKRLEVLSRDNFTCCKCGDTETELHVHHLKYTGEPHEAPLEDLETLCKVCHKYFTFHHSKMINDYNLKGINNVYKFKTCMIIDCFELIILMNIEFEEYVFSAIFKKDSEVIKTLNKIQNG